METIVDIEHNGVRVLELPTYHDSRGWLVALECNVGLPFDLRRAFFIYGVPGDAHRAGHAHKFCHQVLVPVAGHCFVEIDHTVLPLFDPKAGLYVPPGVRIDLYGFSPDAVLLVLASEYYDPDDYVS